MEVIELGNNSTSNGNIERIASVRSRLRSGIFWNATSSIANQGGTFLINIVLANLLGVTPYGQYAMVMSTLLTIATVAQLATGSTVAKYLAEYRSTNKLRASRILSLCQRVAFVSAIAAASVVLLCAQWLTGTILQLPELWAPVMAGSLYIAFSVLNGFQTGILNGLESYRPLALASAVGSAITLIACVCGCRTGGLLGAMWGLNAGIILKFLLFRIAVNDACNRQGLSFQAGRLGSESRILLRFALPGLLSGLTVGPGLWAANAFVARSSGGFSEVGIYSIASSFCTIVLFLPWNISTVVSTLINNQLGLRRSREYEKLFWTNVVVLAVVTTVSAFAVYHLGPTVLRLYGKGFAAGAAPVLGTLMIGVVPEALSMACCQIAISKERVWTSVLAVNVPRDIIYPTCVYFLAARGAEGMATAYLISRLVALLSAATMVALLGTRLEPKPAD